MNSKEILKLKTLVGKLQEEQLFHASLTLKNIITELEQALQPKEWVSVEDRLPSSWTEVMVYYHIDEDRYSMKSAYYDGHKWKYDRLDSDKITHWQPLPQPPNQS